MFQSASALASGRLDGLSEPPYRQSVSIRVRPRERTIGGRSVNFFATFVSIRVRPRERTMPGLCSLCRSLMFQSASALASGRFLSVQVALWLHRFQSASALASGRFASGESLLIDFSFQSASALASGRSLAAGLATATEVSIRVRPRERTMIVSPMIHLFHPFQSASALASGR